MRPSKYKNPAVDKALLISRFFFSRSSGIILIGLWFEIANFSVTIFTGCFTIKDGRMRSSKKLNSTNYGIEMIFS